MAVVSKLIIDGENKTKENNSTIKNIHYQGEDYHFAKKNEVVDGICENAVNEPIIDLKVSGNSVQEVDTSNIWDGTYTTGTYYDNTGTLISLDKMAMTNLMKVNFKYYDVTSVINEANTYNFRYNFFDENKTWLSQILITVKDLTPVETEIEVPNGAKYINFSVYQRAMDVSQKICASLKNTPTPETPIEIESVGEKTKNLLNKDTSENGFINSSGERRITTSYGLTVTDKIYVKPNTTYVYSGMGDVQATTVTRTGYQYDENNNPIKAINPSSGSRVLFTTEPNCHYVYMQYVKTEEKPMLEEGNIASEYEPYGYKLPVKLSGKNLLPQATTKNYTHNGITYEVQIDGSIVCNGTATGTSKFNIANITLQDYVGCVLSGGYEAGGSSTYWLGLNLVGVGDLGGGRKITQEHADMHSTDYVCIRIASGYTVNDLVIKPQLETGDTATAYEPYFEPITTNIYLNEPLRKLGG